MALETIWYFSEIPKTIVDSITEDLSHNFGNAKSSSLLSDGIENLDIRNSTNSWVPAEHWTAGFVWHYVKKANDENFLYDIKCIDNNYMQLTEYREGQYYSWHSDTDIAEWYKPKTIANISDHLYEDRINLEQETVRKLSFIVQLSDPDEYEGGNVQFLGVDKKSYFAPRKRGSVIVFDSRTPHRVCKVTKGTRKSLVGWVVGPRWR